MKIIILMLIIAILVGVTLTILEFSEKIPEEEKARYVERAKLNSISEAEHWAGWKECDKLNRPNELLDSIMKVIEYNTTIERGREAWFGPIYNNLWNYSLKCYFRDLFQFKTYYRYNVTIITKEEYSQELLKKIEGNLDNYEISYIRGEGENPSEILIKQISE